MAGPAIRVESVGKRYQLGVTGGSDLTERLGQLLAAPLQRLRGEGRQRARAEELWALRDVSFDVQPGEIVGLIGPNGAGKSTLLKLLSRITPPTEGRMVVRGRLGSLLEVGTGFHEELTGRENIFLNGSILGMRRREIQAKFDEIVEFSGVARFLDTPVKRYSSGMYVRLAFAVAAHLQPEVLLVDEVLAVGDAEFQRKCLGKMEDVAHQEGRTIVFVSHQLGAVRRLCPRALLIHGGRLTEDGPSNRVIASYLQAVGQTQQSGVVEIPWDLPRNGLEGARATQVALLGADGRPTDMLHFRERPIIEIAFDVDREIPDACVEVGISAAEGTRVVTANNIDGARPPLRLARGAQVVRAEVDAALLPGDFVIDVGLSNLGGGSFEFLERVLTFNVVNAALDDGDVYPWATVRGAVRASSTWSLVETPSSAATLGLNGSSSAIRRFSGIDDSSCSTETA